MKKKVSTVLVVFIVNVVWGRTVKYSNIPPLSENTRGIKTYEIAGPEGNPIRIYEADYEPHWDSRQSHEIDFGKYSTESPPTSTPLTEHNLIENSTKIYSPEALNAFLKSYAERLREKQKSTEATEEVRSSELEKEVSLSIEADEDDYDKSQRWGLVNTKKHDPYKEKDGWVQMEAIPWSSSQISKWQSNKPKPKPQEYYRPDAYHSSSASNEYHKPSYSSYEWQNRFQKPSKPSKPTYEYASNSFSVKPNLDFDRVYQKPSYSVHVSNRPSWNEDRKPYITVNYDSYPVDEDRDIITDGRPSDFPSSYTPRRPNLPYAEALKARPTSSIHPETHPTKGNGEWVLLSTTKGYQYPRQKKERAIAITPNSIGVKRSVQLTVLPPDANSKINMTTSHGGLLEVDATFETVEESQNKQIMSERLQNLQNIQNQQQNLNRTKSKPPRTVQKVQKKKPQRSQPKNDEIALPVVQDQDSRMNHNHNLHRPDTSAVLAAIGAGMVPATMAMLMPFVSGKRRRRSVEFLRSANVTNVPFTEIELTLQKSY